MPSPATPERAGTESPSSQTASLAGWRVSQWFNTPTPIELEDLLGRVVLVHAFQMLCPACVSHGLPQALRVHEAFQSEEVAVIGLHTVFEHHEEMGPKALQAFIHEYRLPFPIGIDQAGGAGPLPVTMAQWGLHGTPSVVLFDRQGRARLHRFGVVNDLVLGAAIGQLLAQGAAVTTLESGDRFRTGAARLACDGERCVSRRCLRGAARAVRCSDAG
ncbi:MAG TPA: TlpA disulfide reductase family protein [Ottowia sp.]|mgnify:CR=1 FL=1|nr:TlpA disulfide reductase family protein [Ottowia sp.]